MTFWPDQATEKKKCFTGGWTSRVRSVGRNFFFFFFFFISGGKNYPKNMKLKKKKKKTHFFAKLIWDNILIYFQTLFRRNFKIFAKKWLFYKILANLKKKILPKREKRNPGQTSNTGFFLCTNLHTPGESHIDMVYVCACLLGCNFVTFGIAVLGFLQRWRSPNYLNWEYFGQIMVKSTQFEQKQKFGDFLQKCILMDVCLLV